MYRNTLALGWEDWSWYSTVDLASREHAHSRPVSIKASLGPRGPCRCTLPGFNTAPYYWLEFYIYVGDNTLRQLSVYFNDAADKELMPKVSVDDPAFIAMGAYIPNRWQRVRIPLSRTGGADTDILRINIKDESGAGQEAVLDRRHPPAACRPGEPIGAGDVQRKAASDIHPCCSTRSLPLGKRLRLVSARDAIQDSVVMRSVADCHEMSFPRAA